MAAPTKRVDSNTKNGNVSTNQRSSAWVIGIVRFNEPSSMADSGDFKAKMEVIQNDCIGVSISNPKGDFGKTCSLALKSTDFWYPGLVTPGDWIFVWMQDNQEKLDRIINLVNKVQSGGAVGNALCDVNSGLKFAGRCLGVTHNDVVQPDGKRTINQGITAQSFIEFATSVYYTASARGIYKELTPPGSSGVMSANQAIAQAGKQIIENIQFNGMDSVLKEIGTKYKEFYMKGDQEYTPDVLIALFFTIIMGIDKDSGPQLPIPGTFNDGIHIPSYVARIFGKDPKKTKKIWQIMNVNLGLQDFKPGNGAWYKHFSPVFDESQSGDVFKRMPIRLKGFVPFAPALWDNISMWDILSNYLNPVCNEMYTALRVNNEGRIVPTLTVREKPFSTGLFKTFKDYGFGGGGEAGDPSIDSPEPKNQSTVIEDEAKNSSDGGDDFGSYLTGKATALAANAAAAQLSSVVSGFFASNSARTLYGKLPRWIISESIVRAFSYESNEAARINFVQVWGQNAGAAFTGVSLNQQKFMSQQFVNGNFFVDQKDIQRNGLRAYIITSPFDVYVNIDGQPSFAKTWAKLNADWLFNGHLKANGSLTVDGIVDPIVEGDNLEYRGILFHIEGVSHEGRVGPGGRKIWTTSLTLSNGLVASSLTNPEGIPSYPAYVGRKAGSRRDDFKAPFVPGLNEIQLRLGDATKTKDGDSLLKGTGVGSKLGL